MSHAQRFDAVGAQKGTALYGVVTALKQVAMVVEQSYDANSPEVVGAMQRFEQGLALVAGAPEQETVPEEPSDDESSSAKPATRRKTTKKPGDEGEAS